MRPAWCGKGPSWLGHCVNRRTLCQEIIARWHTGILCKGNGQGDFVREDAVDTCNRRYVLYCTSSQEEAFRQSGEYCHEMLSGKQVVKWMLSGNLENAVRETSSQTVAFNQSGEYCQGDE